MPPLPFSHRVQGRPDDVRLVQQVPQQGEHRRLRGLHAGLSHLAHRLLRHILRPGVPSHGVRRGRGQGGGRGTR